MPSWPMKTGWIFLAGSWGRVMRLLSALMFCMTLCSGAVAQSWQADLSRDAAYLAGDVSYPGLGMRFTCHARAPEHGNVIDSIWFESTIAPPSQFLIGFSDPLVPLGPLYRDDLTLFVGQTGYRLPRVSWNELNSGWETLVGVSDRMFAALPNATRLVLHVGNTQAWELPVNGLATSLAQAQAHCTKAWQGAVPAPDLRRMAERFAASNCSDFFTLGPQAIRTANIDGDGIPDIVLDYNAITCDNDNKRPGVCGASLCSVDIFLSRTFAKTGQPEQLLGMSAELVPLSNGNQAVATSGNLSICQSTEPCAFYWYWDGHSFTQLQQ